MPLPISAYFGHHKCGTEWMVQIWTQICKASGLRTFHTHWPTKLPFGYERDPEFMPRIASAHAECATGDFDFLLATNADQALVNALLHRGIRGFHVIRDPRDIIVSGYFSHLASHYVHPKVNPWHVDHRARLVQLSQEEGLLLELEFASVYFDRLSRWDYDNPGILETRLETVIANPNEEFRRMLEFCGIRVSGLEEILKNNSFEVLSGGRSPGKTDAGHHFRSGTAGDFRNYFTPRVEAKFQALYPDLIARLGYR